MRIAALRGGVGGGTARTVCQAHPQELLSISSVALYTAGQAGQEQWRGLLGHCSGREGLGQAACSLAIRRCF